MPYLKYCCKDDMMLICETIFTFGDVVVKSAVIASRYSGTFTFFEISLDIWSKNKLYNVKVLKFFTAKALTHAHVDYEVEGCSVQFLF